MEKKQYDLQSILNTWVLVDRGQLYVFETKDWLNDFVDQHSLEETESYLFKDYLDKGLNRRSFVYLLKELRDAF